jgi:hypothetical protein
MAVALGIRGIANCISGILVRHLAGAIVYELLTPYITQQAVYAIAAMAQIGLLGGLQVDRGMRIRENPVAKEA